MDTSKEVLCAANEYEQKYYFNPKFDGLPQNIQEELQILCVTFCENVGGIMMMEFEPDGTLEFEIRSLDADARFDEIGSELKIKEIRREREEFLEALETYYRVFFLGGEE